MASSPPSGAGRTGRVRSPEEITGPVPGRTFVHQAAEVMRCLRAGELESPLVPLDGSLTIMRTLDAVRDRIGLRSPGM